MRKDDHIIVRDNGRSLLCLRCGAVLILLLPMAVDEWIRRSRAFLRSHAPCVERADT